LQSAIQTKKKKTTHESQQKKPPEPHSKRFLPYAIIYLKTARVGRHKNTVIYRQGDGQPFFPILAT